MSSLWCSKLSTGDSAAKPSYVRFLNASPDMLPVDIYANDKCVAGHVQYGQVTDYFSVTPCSYCIRVFPSKSGNYKEPGLPPPPLAEATLTVTAGTVMTLAIVGSAPKTCLLVIPEIYRLYARMRRPNLAALRFVNLVQDAPALEFAPVDGTRLFRSVCFTEHTRYARLEPGDYMFRIRPTGSTQSGFITSEYTLERGVAYTLYAVGLTDGLPPLDTILVQDGSY